MNTHRKYSLILASVMAVILALPGGAWAGGRYDKGGHDYGYQKGGQHSSHYNNRYDGRHDGRYNNHYNNHYNNYYKGGRYYYPYNYGYKSCGNNNNHHNNNNNDNDKLWLGLLGGGIVGYTLSNIYTGY